MFNVADPPVQKLLAVVVIEFGAREHLYVAILMLLQADCPQVPITRA